jgi:hypothetical protein
MLQVRYPGKNKTRVAVRILNKTLPGKMMFSLTNMGKIVENRSQ